MKCSSVEANLLLLLELKRIREKELIKLAKRVKNGRALTSAQIIYVAEHIQKYHLIIARNKNKKKKTNISPHKIKPITEIPGFKLTPRPFQAVGIGFIDLMNGAALIADDMGLGKTVQALGWLQHARKQGPQGPAWPALIVVPAVLKDKWTGESAEWIDKSEVHQLNGFPAPSEIQLKKRKELKKKYPKRKIKRPKPTPSRIDQLFEMQIKKYAKRNFIMVINYDLLSPWQRPLKKAGFKTIIFDEIHYLKNGNSQRAKAAKAIAKKIPHKIALTGTPIENNPIELFPLISILRPGLFESKMDFGMQFCHAVNKGFGIQYVGCSNPEKLHRFLHEKIMIRRMKSEVCSELPNKERVVIPIEIDNRAKYEKAEKDFLTWVRETKGQKAAKRAKKAQALVKVEALKQITMEGKHKAIIKWIEDFLESGEKLVVIAVHREVIEKIDGHFKKISRKIMGGISAKEKTAAKDALNFDPNTRLLCVNLKAAIGLDLQFACSNTLTIELGWTATGHDQAEDRVYRIGQTKAVTAWYILGMNTIETRIADLIDQKRITSTKVMDGETPESSALFTELMDSYHL